MAGLKAINRQDLLGELIRGRADSELIEFVQRLGGQVIIDQVFAEMKRRYHPKRGRAATVQWELTSGDNLWIYQVVINDAGARWTRGPRKKPDLRLRLTLPKFLRFMSGDVDPRMLFFRRQMRIYGGLGALLRAIRILGWFSR
jgi:predicted lipid carrier protein YhbT